MDERNTRVREKWKADEEFRKRENDRKNSYRRDQWKSNGEWRKKEAEYRKKRFARAGNYRRKYLDELLKIQKSRCGLCNKMIEEKESSHVDHIVPISKGGKSELSNLRVVHEECHKKVFREIYTR